MLSDKIDVKLKAQFPQLCLNEIVGLFPNANLHLADKAHSGKRLVSRVFSGIPVMNEVNIRFITSRRSPSKFIHNSEQFHQQYSEQVLGEHIWKDKKLKDLGMSSLQVWINWQTVGKHVIDFSCYVQCHEYRLFGSRQQQ